MFKPLDSHPFEIPVQIGQPIQDSLESAEFSISEINKQRRRHAYSQCL
jgi:hypothetical protein